MLKNCASGEDCINKMRIDMNLRILWPDFQIYDLIGADMTFSEVEHHSSFAPFILRIDLSNKQLKEPLDSKEYTHIAIYNRKEVDENMDVVEVTYAFLTKRNIAVDQIDCKHLYGKYRLDVQVAQLQRKSNLWGAEVVSDQLQVISPKYIAKRNSIWLMEYECSKPIKYIIFYSVERQPAYGKNYYGSYLAKDVRKQGCIKYRALKSVIDSYFMKKGEEELVSFQNHLMLSSFDGMFVSKQKKEQEIKERQKMVSLQSKLQNSSSRKISKISHPNMSFIKPDCEIWQYQRCDFEMILKEKLEEVHYLLPNYEEQVAQYLEENDLKHLEIDITEERQHNFQFKTVEDKIFFLNKIHGTGLNCISEKVLIDLILEIKEQNSKQLKIWISCFDFLLEIHSTNLKQLLLEVMQLILIINGPKLLKDCDSSLVKFSQMMGVSLTTCIKRSLALNYSKQSCVSDLLFILMEVEKFKSIFELYEQYRLPNNSVLVGQSFTLSLERQNIYSNNASIGGNKQNINICFHEYISPFKDENGNDPRDRFKLPDQRMLKVKIANCKKFNFFVSKQFSFQHNRFKILLFLKEEYLYCFIEETTTENAEDPQHLGISSFSINFQVKINGRLMSHNLGWNFVLPSHSVGWKFNLEKSQEISLQFSLYMERNIVAQSVINFFKIRYAEMFHYPEEIRMEENKEDNQRLLKRRSTFMLESECFSEKNSIFHDCFFHKQCESCCKLVEEANIYQIKPIDMYSLLFGLKFRRQINFILPLMKFISLHFDFGTIQLFKTALRLNFLKLVDLFMLLKEYRLDISCEQILKKIIENKLQVLSISGDKAENIEISIFRQKPRGYETMVKFIEGDYTKQYLEYLISQKS